MDTKNLLRQHQDMLDLAAKICAYQGQQQVKENATTISMLLSELAGKLKMHLTVEDQFVYPKLAQNSDVKVQKISHDFANEMGDLGAIFGDYKTRYLGATKITNHADIFLTDTKNVFAALTKRMDKENRLLYPLLNN